MCGTDQSVDFFLLLQLNELYILVIFAQSSTFLSVFLGKCQEILARLLKADSSPPQVQWKHCLMEWFVCYPHTRPARLSLVIIVVFLISSVCFPPPHTHARRWCTLHIHCFIQQISHWHTKQPISGSVEDGCHGSTSWAMLPHDLRCDASKPAPFFSALQCCSNVADIQWKYKMAFNPLHPSSAHQCFQTICYYRYYINVSIHGSYLLSILFNVQHPGLQTPLIWLIYQMLFNSYCG